MRVSHQTLVSLIIYVVSVASLTAADFFVVSFLDKNSIAQWAFYKSLIFVCGSLCILGFDQLLLREINQYSNFKKQFLIQSSLVALLVSIFLIFYRGDAGLGLLYFLILIFYSHFMFEAGFWRANNKLIYSQLNTNLWKSFIFLGLLFNFFLEVKADILYIFCAAFLLAFVILFVLNYFSRKSVAATYMHQEKTSKDKNIEYFFTGLYFFLHSFSLVMANYGEQFLINLFGSENLSSTIFTYVTIYSSVVLAGIGFLGFYLGPKIRREHAFDKKRYGYYKKYVAFFGMLMILLNSALIYLLYDYFFSKILFDVYLWLLILILTFLRVIYVFPSLCLGVFGSQRYLKLSSLYSLIAVALYIVGFYVVLKFNFEYLQYLVVVVMILHWLVKVLISNYYVQKSLVEKSMRESI